MCGCVHVGVIGCACVCVVMTGGVCVCVHVCVSCVSCISDTSPCIYHIAGNSCDLGRLASYASTYNYALHQYFKIVVYSPEDAVSVIPLSPERNLASLARHAFGEEDCGQ